MKPTVLQKAIFTNYYRENLTNDCFNTPRILQNYANSIDNDHTSCFRNRTMRTVTNYFIVNLAVADFLVILICLPPTVLWDVTETWFMGTLACKLVLYFQVSVLA